MPSLSIYLLTFNCARQLINPLAFAPAVFKALPADANLPDIVVVSLQEIAPIAYSFLGGGYLTPYFDRVNSALRIAAAERARSQPGEDGIGAEYKNVLTRNVGMTGIMVFCKPDAAANIRWIRAGGTGVGLWDMGNKGAVGVRLGYAAENERTQELVFVSAHLAAFEDQVERRNQDWSNICASLVFAEELTRKRKPDGSERNPTSGDDANQPLLSETTYEDSSGGQILSLYHPPGALVFIAGDLNYRTRDSLPGPHDHKDYPDAANPSEEEYAPLLKDDQLTRERAAGRVFQGFDEMPITFPPTYKYSFKQPEASGQSSAAARSLPNEHERCQEWAKHRFPSWCDRILFLQPPSARLKPFRYTSLGLQPTSDHMPVALSASLSLDPPPSDNGEGLETAERPPAPVNKNWKASREVARRKEILIGCAAYLALTTEGITALAAIAFGALTAYVIFKNLL